MLVVLQLAASSWVAAAAPLELHTDAADLARTEAGLRARTGDALDRFTIIVSPTDALDTVLVHLQGPDGANITRTLVLGGQTIEDRSRELAASLALLMEAAEAPAPASYPSSASSSSASPPEPSPPAPAPVRGWLGLGPRVELGTGVLAEAGVDLQGGAWLAREHVQPLLSAGFTATSQAGISLLHTRVGGGLAVGAPLRDRRIWLGGHVLAHALWIRAHEARTATTWHAATEVGGLLQYRGRRLTLGLRSGVDLTLPPLAVQGSRARIRRGPARFFVGLVVGLAFG